LDFNTERAIPYMPEPRPVVQKEEIDIDSEDYDEDDLD
jgi:hypothetical protein